MFVHRIGSALIALAGVLILGVALVQLKKTADTADRAATAALNANGGYMQGDEFTSHRQIAAEAHLEKCALIGLAGITLMGVGVRSAMILRPGK